MIRILKSLSLLYRYKARFSSALEFHRFVWVFLLTVFICAGAFFTIQTARAEHNVPHNNPLRSSNSAQPGQRLPSGADDIQINTGSCGGRAAGLGLSVQVPKPPQPYDLPIDIEADCVNANDIGMSEQLYREKR